jgi:hypothetical protein
MSKKWNANMMFPTDSCFVNRIVGASFGPSKGSGNPMLTINTELVSPQEYEIDGEQVVVAGVKATNYFVTQVNKPDGTIDEEKTANCRANLADPTKGLWVKLGLDPNTINWDNIDTKPLLGKLIYTMMSPDKEEKRANPTAAELAKDKHAEGKVLRNPVTNQPLVNYWPKVREIFGVAPSDGVTVAY